MQPSNSFALAAMLGDQHFDTATSTPLRDDAFELQPEEKIRIIARHFREIMHTLGLDLADDSLKGTPNRVARMYVEEIFNGLDPANKPDITLFDNKYRYKQMMVEKNISFYSCCEHHFVPIFGKVHVAYLSSGKVIGLSKINRIVRYYARRPQVQERLTVQLAQELKDVLATPDVAVVVDATHLCVASRGVQDTHSSTITAAYEGRFQLEATRNELLSFIKS
jgi:GTP cyclohydrolase I